MKIRSGHRWLTSAALAVVLLGHQALAAAPVDRSRVVVLTDIENEPDDAESLVRLLTYANQFDIEGLVATTSIHLRDHTAPGKIKEIVDAYGAVRDNLERHEPGFPTGAKLSALVTSGLPVYGLNGVGEGHDSPGSEAIIAAVDRDDPRPVWVLVWGGPNTLAQALWKVSQTRKPPEVAKFVAKLRVYAISDQDDSGPWIRASFPNLFYIVSPGFHAGGAYHFATWSGISGDHFHGRFAGGDFSSVSNEWLATNIRAKGPLGAAYPEPKFLMEGDTPSFLYLIPNGLGAPEHPEWGSWGGRYEFYTPRFERWHLSPETRPIWTDAQDEVMGADGQWHTTNKATIWRWRQAYQNDFAARMDWTIKPVNQANHPPRARLDHPDRLTAKLGDRVDLSAALSSDPDGDKLSYQWFYYGEAGSFVVSSARSGAPIKIEDADKAKAWFTVPTSRVFRTGTLHIVVAVTDSGTPALTRYKRVIVDVAP